MPARFQICHNPAVCQSSNPRPTTQPPSSCRSPFWQPKPKASENSLRFPPGVVDPTTRLVSGGRASPSGPARQPTRLPRSRLRERMWGKAPRCSRPAVPCSSPAPATRKGQAVSWRTQAPEHSPSPPAPRKPPPTPIPHSPRPAPKYALLQPPKRPLRVVVAAAAALEGVARGVARGVGRGSGHFKAGRRRGTVLHHRADGSPTKHPSALECGWLKSFMSQHKTSFRAFFPRNFSSPGHVAGQVMPVRTSEPMKP